MASYVEKKESPESSSINLSKKPYQAPYARVSSIEDPCTRNSEYGKAPETSLDAVPASVVSIKAHASDFEKLKLEKIPETSEKHQVKESSKGFRRLLKLGRKNSSSTAESDNASGDVSRLDDNSTVSASSSSSEGNVNFSLYTLIDHSFLLVEKTQCMILCQNFWVFIG